MISIVIPTIKGREVWLERAVNSFCRTMPHSEMIVLNDFPTCGEAWNEGIRQVKGDPILLAADDLEAHDGWWQEGISWLERGIIPCPRILNTDGSLQSCGADDREHETGTPSPVARVPFLTREMVDALYPIFPNQYAGDYWITWKAQQLGWGTMVVRDMVFTHHLVQEGRLNTLSQDWGDFQSAIRMSE